MGHRLPQVQSLKECNFRKFHARLQRKLILTNWFSSTCSKWVSYVPFKTGASRDMIQNTTYGIHATSSWTWVNTVQILACFVRGTVRIDHTFWSTCNIWVPKIVWDASAWSRAISLLAVCIRPTRWGVAGVDNFNRDWCCKQRHYIPKIKIIRHTCCNSRAESKWVPGVPRITGANRVMVLSSAGSMCSTHSWAGVHTFLVNTSLVCWALWVDWALWFALSVWVSKQSWQARARCCTISLSAFSIDTTRWWAAWVNYFRSWTGG